MPASASGESSLPLTLEVHVSRRSIMSSAPDVVERRSKLRLTGESYHVPFCLFPSVTILSSSPVHSAKTLAKRDFFSE